MHFFPGESFWLPLQFMLCASSTSTSLFLFCRQHFIPPSHHSLFSCLPPVFLPTATSALSCIFFSASQHFNYRVFSPLNVIINIKRGKTKTFLSFMCSQQTSSLKKKNLVCFLLLLSDIRAYQKAANISFMFKLFTECLFETEWDCLLDLHTQL